MSESNSIQSPSQEASQDSAKPADLGGKPSVIAHGLVCGAGIAGAAFIWVFTSWSVAYLLRDWGYCQISGPMAPAKLKPNGNRQSAIWEFVNPWWRETSQSMSESFSRISIFVPGREPVGSISPAFVKDPALKPLLIRLDQQAQAIAFLEWRNCDIAAYFLNRQLSTLSMGTLTALVASASLVWISKQGWDKANKLIINLCITSGLITVGSITYANLFGYVGAQSNSNLYMAAYLRDAAIGQRLRSAAATAVFTMSSSKDSSMANGAYDLSTPKGLRDLLQDLDRQIGETNITGLTIDSSFIQQTGQKLLQMGGTGR